MYVVGLDAEEQRPQSYRYAADKPFEVDPASPDHADAKSLEYREPCRKPKGQGESDLCAQWRAAYAGEESAYWAKWAFWTGLIGIGGLLTSLYYTREAVRIAGEATADADTALVAAKDSASAAINLVKASKDAASHDLRPWIAITVVPTEFRMNGNLVEFNTAVKIANIGRSIAQKIKVEVLCKYVTYNDGFDFADDYFRKFTQQTKSDFALIPKDEASHEVSIWSALNRLPWDGAENNRAVVLLVLVSVNYSSSFSDEPCWTQQSYSVGYNRGDFMDQRFLYETMIGATQDDLVIKRFRSGKIT